MSRLYGCVVKYMKSPSVYVSEIQKLAAMFGGVTTHSGKYMAKVFFKWVLSLAGAQIQRSSAECYTTFTYLTRTV